MLKEEDAFTLIEMLIVLVIISVLILLIIPNLSGKTQTVHERGCEALKMVVQSQADAYAVEEKKVPENISVLVNAGYLQDSQITCEKDGEKIFFKLEDGKVKE